MSRYLIGIVFLLLITSCARSPELLTHAPAPGATPVPAAAAPQFRMTGAPGYMMGNLEIFVDAAQGLFAEERQAPAERLIIQSASLQLETESFDDAVESLRNIPSAFDGYAQSERLFTVHRQRQFEIVIRVPAADFENMLNQIQLIASTRSINVSAEDVTDQFYDMASRLETRLIEEDRILALIGQTNDLTELIQLESRLSNTRLQIARYRTSLTDLAGRIAYSTIRVHLFDIEKIYEAVAQATFGERVGGAFGSSIDATVSVIQFIIIVIAGAIIPLAVISPVVILLVFHHRKKTAVSHAESG